MKAEVGSLSFPWAGDSGQPKESLETEPQPGSPSLRGPKPLSLLLPHLIMFMFCCWHWGLCRPVAIQGSSSSALLARPRRKGGRGRGRARAAQEEPCWQEVGEGAQQEAHSPSRIHPPAPPPCLRVCLCVWTEVWGGASLWRGMCICVLACLARCAHVPGYHSVCRCSGVCVLLS